MEEPGIGADQPTVEQGGFSRLVPAACSTSSPNAQTNPAGCRSSMKSQKVPKVPIQKVSPSQITHTGSREKPKQLFLFSQERASFAGG